MFPNLFKRPAPQKQPLFAPGSLKLSEKVHWLARKGLIDPLTYVQRHVRGDWGEIDKATRKELGVPRAAWIRQVDAATIELRLPTGLAPGAALPLRA